MFSVKKFPWVQVPAGEIGVVTRRSARPSHRRQERGVQAGVRQFLPTSPNFIEQGGQKGVQRRCCSGHVGPDAPVAFLVITPQTVYGMPVSPELVNQSQERADDARVVRPLARSAAARRDRARRQRRPLWRRHRARGRAAPSGDIASRLGASRRRRESSGPRRRQYATTDAEAHRSLLGSRTRCTTTNQTSRRSSTPVARSGSSTTRCCMARTS